MSHYARMISGVIITVTREGDHNYDRRANWLFGIIFGIMSGIMSGIIIAKFKVA